MSRGRLELTGSEVLDAPAAVVFEALFDPIAQLQWNSLYLSVSVDPPGRPAEGAVISGRFKGAGKAVFTVENVVDGRSFTHRSRLLMFGLVNLGAFSHHFEVSPGSNGALATQRVTVELTRIGRMLHPVLQQSFAKRLPESFAELADYLAKQLKAEN